MSCEAGQRAYIRNGVTGWPVERQRKALADAGFNGPIYEDALTRNQQRGRNVAALEQRAQMLRPTSRQDPQLILVASIRILALSPVDLTAALAAAAACRATVRALDTGLEIGPAAGAAEFAAACAAWDKARRSDQTLAGREKGRLAAEATKTAKREPRLAQARELWAKPSDEISVQEIAHRVGLSVATLYNHLEPRSRARRRTTKKGTTDA